MPAVVGFVGDRDGPMISGTALGCIAGTGVDLWGMYFAAGEG